MVVSKIPSLEPCKWLEKRCFHNVMDRYVHILLACKVYFNDWQGELLHLSGDLMLF